MLNRSSNSRVRDVDDGDDVNVTAARVVAAATGALEHAHTSANTADRPEPDAGAVSPSDPAADDSAATGKNPAAVALGRLGGKKGGKARAASLTPEQRSEIARKAAAARWAAKRGEQ